MIAFALTLFAAVLAWHVKRDGLTSLLIPAWGASMVAALLLRDEWLPGAYAMIDGAVAVAALSLWTKHQSQRARFVGLISIALICCHFGYSASGGVGNWTLYASLLNAGFVAQCFTAGGGWNGLANLYDRFRGRDRRLHLYRDRGR